MRTRDRKPILWAFSLSRLDPLLESVIPHFAEAANIRVFHKVFKEALDAANDLIQQGEEVDVLISAGASAAYLRKHATVPVVSIQPTGFDMLHALAKARRLSRFVGIVSFGGVTPELEQFKELYGLEIEQRSYETIDEAEARVRELAAKGVEVVVGPSFVTDISERIGLRGVFLYSESAVREAIGRAIELARVARAEEAKRDRIDAILRHLEEGVVAVDQEERIQSVNPAMERILNRPAEALLGQPLSRVAPGLGLARVLETGDTELELIQRLGNRDLMTNCIPIREQGVQTGAVITCQEASTIERADRRLRQQRPAHLVARHRLADAIGASAGLRRARMLAERYGGTEATVLLTGESGTGKEIFAQGIHAASARRDRPFVAVNCAALPETLLESELFGYEEGAFTGARRGGKLGLFEIAHTGTIFLDEIGDMPLALQTRLLRVLQQREVLRLGARDATPVDVRVIAATNRDLSARIAQGAFREDLYYRLNILKLHLPPLRERPEDVPLVAEHLLDQAQARHGAPDGPRMEERRERVLAAIEPRLLSYAWPGNVRELENVMERVAVLLAAPPSQGEEPAGDGGREPIERELATVIPELFEHAPRGDGETLRTARRGSEREHVLRILAECGGNHSLAARKLGIGRTTLWRKLRVE